MRENAGQPAARHRLCDAAAGCPAFLALRCICCSACLALCVALVPLGVGVSPAAHPYVQRSEAHAENLANPNYYAFVESCATAAGLSVADYVATVCGIGTAVTGAQYATSNIIQLGRDAGDAAADNLVAIMDAAGQPRWEDLSAEEQTAYGTKENYNAQQFVKFSDSIGLGTARDGFLGSGGHTFDDGEIEILQRIGRIGNGWLVGETFSFNEVSACMPNPNAYIQYVSGGEVVSDEILNGQLKVYTSPEVKWWRDYNRWYGTTLQFLGNVKVCVWRMAGNPNAYRIVYCSENNLNYGSKSEQTTSYPQTFVENPTAWNSELSEVTTQGKTFYWGTSGFSSNSDLISNIPVITFDGNYSDYDSTVIGDQWGMALYICYAMLYGDRVYQEIEGTPENIINDPPSAEEVPAVQYPEDGINQDTTYPDLVSRNEPTPNPPYVPPGPDERPESPYNPSNPDNPQYQSGTPEWKQETMENMTPILNIRLHALFPFSLIYDLQLMWDRLNGVLMGGSELGEQAVDDYLHIRIPVTLQAASLGIDYDEEMVLDLTHLRDLLLTIKPFMAYLLSFSLLMGLISFWRRILTGA